MTTRVISEAAIACIRAEAENRCGYCLTPQRYAMQVLEIEHLTPRAAGGSDEEENLWLACRLCNNAKGVKTDGDDPVNRPARSTLQSTNTEVAPALLLK